MQSSFMNSEKLRLIAATHSPRESRCGDEGVRPTCSVAVDKAETAELGFRLAFPSAAEDQPRGGADATREEKSGTQRACGHGGQIRTQLRADVRCFADFLSEVLGGSGELFPLGFDIAPDLLDCA
jgi:hypothetical protein